MIYPAAPYEELVQNPPMKRITSKKEIEESYVAYLTDESRLPGGVADELVFVYSEKQIVETLRRASFSGISITVSSGRTGIVGGAVPSGGIVMVMENMNRFLGVRWDEERNGWIIRSQPGLSIEGLKERLDKKRFDDVIYPYEEDDGEDLQRFIAESNEWFYPPDPTEKSAHIGGTIATNASGARSYKYGQTRHYVMALRVALADGTILSMHRGEFIALSDKGFCIQKGDGSIRLPIPSYAIPNIKSAAGYFVSDPMDFMDFFIGSEGTLGVITEVELLLRRKAEFTLGIVTFFSTEIEAIQFVKGIKHREMSEVRAIDPSVLEYIDCYSLEILRKKRHQEGSSSFIPPFPSDAKAAIYIEQEGKKEDLEYYCTAYLNIITEFGANGDETWGGIDYMEISKMAAFRHAIAEEINAIIGQRQKVSPTIHKVGMDFVVPESALEEMLGTFRSKLDENGFEYAIFGHIGENHLHVNILPKNGDELFMAKESTLELARIAVSLGGTVSGEHGIGKIKKALLKMMFDRAAINEMRKVKEALDPKGLLGRETIF